MDECVVCGQLIEMREGSKGLEQPELGKYLRDYSRDKCIAISFTEHISLERCLHCNTHFFVFYKDKSDYTLLWSETEIFYLEEEEYQEYQQHIIQCELEKPADKNVVDPRGIKQDGHWCEHHQWFVDSHQKLLEENRLLSGTDDTWSESEPLGDPNSKLLEELKAKPA